ncbi:MAG: hypothetical protein IT500_15630, partial [Rubrivivax sp.]|nr:hypothetical protein [Rubrivivax sp.]
RKSTLAEGIEKAAKPDCRKAYGGMGALAIIPLAADALRDGGCRWSRGSGGAAQVSDGLTPAPGCGPGAVCFFRQINGLERSGAKFA